MYCWANTRIRKRANTLRFVTSVKNACAIETEDFTVKRVWCTRVGPLVGIRFRGEGEYRTEAPRPLPTTRWSVDENANASKSELERGRETDWKRLGPKRNHSSSRFKRERRPRLGGLRINKTETLNYIGTAGAIVKGVLASGVGCGRM